LTNSKNIFFVSFAQKFFLISFVTEPKNGELEGKNVGKRSQSSVKQENVYLCNFLKEVFVLKKK
jgi:hypothetical protein